MKDLRYEYRTVILFMFLIKTYKSHRMLYKVFTLRIYDCNTFYYPYNIYDIFYGPNKYLCYIYTTIILSTFLITTMILFTFLIKCIRAIEHCKKINATYMQLRYFLHFL